jgi:hypothetical protein
MVIFTLMFAGLMLLSAQSRRRLLAISLIGCVAVLVVAPTPAQGQLCLPCIIQAVLDTIGKVIGNWLNLINGVLTDIRNFYQQTVWPLNLINQAKAQIMAMIAQFRGQMQGIFSTNPHTATLPNPVALEIILRNRQTGDLGSVGQVYVNAFRPVPQAGLMAPQDRDMTDMDDAMAQNNLKTLKMSDQAQDLMTNWLSAGKPFDAVIANNDESAIGAIQAMKAANVDMKAVIVGGVDATQDALAAMKAGDLDATVFQDAAGQGAGALDAALKLAKGEAVDKKVYIPFQLVTPANMDNFIKKN